MQVFKQRHYWSMELGNVVCLGISTVRFRSNAFRCGRQLLQPQTQICIQYAQLVHEPACITILDRPEEQISGKTTRTES